MLMLAAINRVMRARGTAPPGVSVVVDDVGVTGVVPGPLSTELLVHRGWLVIGPWAGSTTNAGFLCWRGAPGDAANERNKPPQAAGGVGVKRL